MRTFADVQFGLDTFGDMTVDAEGRRLGYPEVLRHVVDQGVLADRVGVDAFGLGEHHRDDYAISSPEVVLGAIAGCTEKILLGTAVTVLSSDDPVRVYEKFATLDGISAGRAEIQIGRGSFTESFPLFGYDLADYEVLFEEKLDLLTQLLREQPVSWSGRTRAPLEQADVFPKTDHGIRTWIGVGGSPESVVRAARHGHPLMLAIIGGQAARFAPYVDLYHRALDQLGRDPLPVGVHSPGHIGETDERAREELYSHFQANRDRIGRERGWGPGTREQFENEADHGALLVGSSETVARKIADTVKTLGLSRFDLKYSHGTLPHELLMDSIGRYGTEVIPRVRELLAD